MQRKIMMGNKEILVSGPEQARHLLTGPTFDINSNETWDGKEWVVGYHGDNSWCNAAYAVNSKQGTFDYKAEGYVCPALHRVRIIGCRDCEFERKNGA